jgi:hypothetical protein
VDPALEGAGRVGVERAEHAYEDLLGEILRVLTLAGEAVREAVDAGRVLLDDSSQLGTPSRATGSDVAAGFMVSVLRSTIAVPPQGRSCRTSVVPSPEKTHRGP